MFHNGSNHSPKTPCLGRLNKLTIILIKYIKFVSSPRPNPTSPHFIVYRFLEILDPFCHTAGKLYQRCKRLSKTAQCSWVDINFRQLFCPCMSIQMSFLQSTQSGHWGSEDYRLPFFPTILSTNYRLFNTLSTTFIDN